jgi:hypothetical protein
MGILWVGFSHTVPDTVNTIPVQLQVQYLWVTGGLAVMVTLMTVVILEMLATTLLLSLHATWYGLGDPACGG